MEENPILDYIEKQEKNVAGKLSELRAIILKAVPDAEEKINYGIPAFALIQGGKRDEQIMIAAYKNHIGFYPHPTTIEKFRKSLKPFKIGKGSVQFKLSEPLPENLLIEMIQYRKSLLR